MEKRFIPGTNPNWNRELSDEDVNSLVDAAGNNYDNGYNFDERLDDDEEDLETKRETAEKGLSNAALTAVELEDELDEKAS